MIIKTKVKQLEDEDRRVFYVDVGDKSPDEAIKELETIKRAFSQRKKS